jgi:hypothetical protein
VLGMLARQPQLLLYQPGTLVSHLAGLLRLLGVPHDVAAAMLQRYPNLLLYTTTRLEVGWGVEGGREGIVSRTLEPVRVLSSCSCTLPSTTLVNWPLKPLHERGPDG